MSSRGLLMVQLIKRKEENDSSKGQHDLGVDVENVIANGRGYNGCDNGKAVEEQQIFLPSQENEVLSMDEMFCNNSSLNTSIGINLSDIGNLQPLSSAEAMLKDLKSMFHLIPKTHQGFYKKLTSDPNMEDDIDGFGGEPDFEVTEDE